MSLLLRCECAVRFSASLAASCLVIGLLVAGCGRNTATGTTPATTTSTTPPTSDASVAIPPPPAAPDAPPVQVFAQMRAQVDSLPPEADPGMLMQAAAMARNLGDLWRTEELLRTLWKQDPKDPKVRTRLADTLEREMRLPEARALYDGLRKDDPKNVRAYLGLASVSLTQRNRGEAWKWLEQAAKKCTESAPDLVLIAQRYEEWDDLAAADRTLRHALAAAPNDMAVTVERASLLLRAGKSEEARKLLEPVTATEPENPAAWKTLAKAWSITPASSGQQAGARPAVEKAVALNPQDPEVHRYAALVYRALGEKRRAAQELAQSLTASPNQAEARYMLAQLYGELGKPDWQKDQIAVCGRVRVLQREQNLAIGRASERPLDPQVRIDVGKAAEKMGDYAGAIREYQIAVGLAPGNGSARTALESIYNRLAWPTPPKGPKR